MWERERKNEQFKERWFVSFSSGAVLHVDQSHIFPPWNGESWGGKATALAAWHALRPLDSSLNLYSRGFFVLCSILLNPYSLSLYSPHHLSHMKYILNTIYSHSLFLSPNHYGLLLCSSECRRNRGKKHSLPHDIVVQFSGQRQSWNY